MKTTLLLALAALLTATSCQTSSAEKTSSQRTANQEYQELIKSDKKKQSDLDLPFRSLPVDVALETITFGSCADQDQAQPIWASVEKNQPQLMIMLGDNIYASSPQQKPISDQYKKWIKIPEYRSIREKVPFMATWDDHDYGQNDGGSTNPEKTDAKVQFLKNWPYVKNLISDDQDGVYHSKFFTYKKNSLQVIMLDTRSERSDLKKNEEQNLAEKAVAPKPYLPDSDKSKHMLSEKQWKWFEEQLKKPAKFRIIASSVQVIANDHQFEKWGNFPHERERFFNLLKKHNVKNALILSGDRHMASIAKTEIKGLGTLYDVTSSGLNRPARPGNNTSDSSYIADGYGPVNFGLLKINWADQKATVEIRSLENEKVQGVEIKF